MKTIDDVDTAARLRRAVTRMNRRLRQSALGGVSPAQASLLASVDHLGRPTLGDLAAVEQIQPPSVTRLVRQLASDGLIVLVTDDVDRRATRATLTSAGRAELSSIRRRKTEFLESRLRELSPDDQAKVADLVSVLEHLLGQA